ncbi:MAG: BtaA family protein [Bacteroidia bacterium]|nr:BtaA family protein [Bacteroidia bacterium]
MVGPRRLSISQSASFDFIRYATVWEDPKVLLKALNIQKHDQVLSIASAGDNCFSLLMADPKRIVAADINPVQLYLTELKIRAIEQLTYSEILAFLGYSPASNRAELFYKLVPHLSKDAANYFSKTQSKWHSTGIIHQGKFEKYFQIFSNKVLPLIHGKSTVEALLAPKSAHEQRQFFLNQWNTWRWRGLFKLFFSRTVMGRMGRDPEFLKQVEIPVADFILKQAESHLSSVNAQQNPFLRYNLTGSFGELLPHYLHPQNYEFIKARIHRISLFHGFAEDAISQYGHFHAMNLSNIFEYMNLSEFQDAALKLSSGLFPDGRMAYWNLMVTRRCSQVVPTLTEQSDLMSELRPQDNGYFYNTIVIDIRNQLSAGSGQPTADSRPLTTDHRSPTTIHLHPLNSKTLAISVKSRQPSAFSPQPNTENRSLTTDHRSPITDHRSPTTDLRNLITWSKHNGYNRIVCPMNGSTWNDYRLKTASHRNFLGDLPYQPELIELFEIAGFKPIERYVSTLMHEIPGSISRLDERKSQLEIQGISFRHLNLNLWEQELQNIHELSLVAFQHNPYYTPIHWKDFLLKYNEIKHLIDPEWVLLAELERNLQGFVFAYLDIENNSIIMKTVARKPDFRLGGLGLVMTDILQQKAKKLGIFQVVHSFMHIDAASLRCSESLEAEIISEYQLFGIDL